MDAAHDDAMTGGTLITFALTPDEAISIINAQELGPIMAVTAHKLGLLRRSSHLQARCARDSPAGGGWREATGVVTTLNVCR